MVPLGKGDIIMFPSLFLFPHGVTEARKGKRYSAVLGSVTNQVLHLKADGSYLPKVKLPKSTASPVDSI